MSITHVDDWLDEIPADLRDEGQSYARWFLEQARFPAWKKSIYSTVMKQFALFCDYEGRRYRCTGASRLGDVWLADDHEQTHGYDHRVDVAKCSNWGPKP
jgi:hypothetical protein